MKYDPDKHHRRSMRLQGYDYSSSGAYFVTICVQNRACLFGQVKDNEMHLNNAGRMVQRAWEQLPQRFPTLGLDEYVVMPNHFHAIVVLAEAPAVAPLVGATMRSASRQGAEGPLTLGDMVGAFKSITTVEYTRGVRQSGWAAFESRLWQRNYWERIIRDELALLRIREYIQTNPARWAADQLHPKAVPNRCNE